jgi:hypothetical protein
MYLGLCIPCRLANNEILGIVVKIVKSMTELVVLFALARFLVLGLWMFETTAGDCLSHCTEHAFGLCMRLGRDGICACDSGWGKLLSALLFKWGI